MGNSAEKTPMMQKTKAKCNNLEKPSAGIKKGVKSYNDMTTCGPRL